MSLRGTGKKAVTDVTKLSGPEKAAVVLLQLGEDHLKIWQALDEEEIKEISQAMAGLARFHPTWSRTCWSSSSPT